MKNRKWLTYTLGALLTLIVLAAVSGTSFRIGMMQNAAFQRPAIMRNFDDGTRSMPGNPQNNGGPQFMQNNFRKQGFDEMRGNNRSFDRRGGGMPFFAHIFGLIHLLILGLLIWVVYKLIKNSGWRLTRVEATPAPEQTVSAEEVGKKKASK